MTDRNNNVAKKIALIKVTMKPMMWVIIKIIVIFAIIKEEDVVEIKNIAKKEIEISIA